MLRGAEGPSGHGAWRPQSVGAGKPSEGLLHTWGPSVTEGTALPSASDLSVRP